MPSGGRPWRRTVARLRAERRNCALCRCVIDYEDDTRGASFTIDHIVPTSLGGTDAAHNLRVVCRSCNSSRGNSTRGEYPTSRRW